MGRRSGKAIASGEKARKEEKGKTEMRETTSLAAAAGRTRWRRAAEASVVQVKAMHKARDADRVSTELRKPSFSPLLFLFLRRLLVEALSGSTLGSKRERIG
jgi:hypothetical protein